MVKKRRISECPECKEKISKYTSPRRILGTDHWTCFRCSVVYRKLAGKW